MVGFKRPEDFEIDGGLARCRVCHSPGEGQWKRLANMRTHEEQKSHKENVERKLRRAREIEDAPRPSQGPLAPTVSLAPQEDFTLFDAPLLPSTWFDDSRLWETHATDSNPPEDNERAQRISAAMDNALAGRVSFTAGDEESLPGGGDSEVTLEDVLSGAGLLRAVLHPDGEEEEEREWWSSDVVEEMRDEDVIGAPIDANEVSQQFFGGQGVKETYFPYPNKGMMKTDILFSSPELRFSRAQKEAVLAWGRDLGAQDVPSLYKIDKFQKDALAAYGNPTHRVQTSSGHVFYQNSVHHHVAMQYAHPDIRPCIKAYPVFNHGRVSETYHGTKWLVDAPDDLLTPMIRLNGQDFYVNELTYCIDDQWCIPLRFFEFEGQGMWAVCYKVQRTKEGLVVHEKREMMPCSGFRNSWPEIEAANPGKQLFASCSTNYASKMPNPDRITAEGLEWECPPVVVFIDDVSGNSSKQWNVHYSCYMSNGGLPRSEIEKSRNIQFVSTSPNASPMEIMEAVCNDIRNTWGTSPIKVWDVRRRRHILIRLWLLFLPGDNPMQAELCSHIGLRGNHFCRCCHVGGDQKFKQSDEGYASLLKPGRERTVSETRDTVLAHLIQATHAAAEKPLKDAITSTGTKDSLALPTINRLIALGKILRRSTPQRKALTPDEVNKELSAELLRLKDHTMVNPLLSMRGLDIHRDTPVEPLHTHLLGVVKYFWAQTVWVLEKQGKFATFQARLNSLAKSGLSIPNILADYMCRYRGALIGKHFKTISQVMAIAVCNLVDNNLQNAWLSVGRVTVLLWETEIVNMQEYLKDLRKAINDVLDHAVLLSPGLLTEKNKLHILLHIPDDIERHGPSLLFSTERYESFNHIFRLCSIHSNRQAPSRDIAMTFANQDRCRHIVTGGYWLDQKSGQWICASATVRAHIHSHSVDANLLGVPLIRPSSSLPAGKMTLSPLLAPVASATGSSGSHSSTKVPSRPLLRWGDTLASRMDNNLRPQADAEGPWHAAVSVIAMNGDKADIGAEVVFQLRPDHSACAALDSDAAGMPSDPQAHSRLRFASVVELLRAESPSHPEASLIIVRESILEDNLHPILHLPVVSRTGVMRVLRPNEILCVINVQHDCSRANCTASGKQTIRQEREDTSRTRAVFSHTSSPLYVVNTHALHNQHWIRNTLPPHLKVVPTFFDDRATLHRQAASMLRDGKLQKKLAKEAAVRKSAEDALRSLNALASVDLIGLASGESDDPVVPPNEVDAIGGSEDPESGAFQEGPCVDEDNSIADTAGLQSTNIFQAVLQLATADGPRGPRQRRTAPSQVPGMGGEGSRAISSSVRGRGRGGRRGATRTQQAPRPTTHQGITQPTAQTTREGVGKSADGGTGHFGRTVHSELVQQGEAATPNNSILPDRREGIVVGPACATGDHASGIEQDVLQIATIAQASDSKLTTGSTDRPARKRRRVAGADVLASAAREKEIRAMFENP